MKVAKSQQQIGVVTSKESRRGIVHIGKPGSHHSCRARKASTHSQISGCSKGLRQTEHCCDSQHCIISDLAQQGICNHQPCQPAQPIIVVRTLEEPLGRFPAPAEDIVETAGLASTGATSSWVWASGPSSQVLMMPVHPPDPSSGRMDLQKMVRIWSAAMPPRQHVAGANTSIRRTYTQTHLLELTVPVVRS